MLRASSEIAVAMKVESTAEKPISTASARPRCRAATISGSEVIATRISPDDTVALSVCAFELLIQVRQPFFQIKRCRHAFQCQTQLHHGKRNFRLNPNEHCLRPTQADHLSDFAESA